MNKHYSEDELARFAATPENARESSAIARHVEECADCRATIESFRQLSELLADEFTWLLTDAVPSDDAAEDERLRSLVETAAKEDEDALDMLGRLIDNAAAIAFADLPRKRRYHTAGVARFLCRAARDMLGRKPADALVIADNAIAVAEALDSRKYAATMRHPLIGTAWKERANALRMLGDYVAALNALDHAERAFRNARFADLELARIQFIRATVYEKTEKLERATELALQCADEFSRLGQLKWRVSALMIIGGVRQKQSRFAEAREIFSSLIAPAEATGDAVLAACLRQNAAWAETELGLCDDAETNFLASLAVFEERGLSSYAIRAQWGLARGVLLKGRPREAVDDLLRVLEEALRLQMHITAGMIILDLAEALIALNRRKEIPPLCRYAVSVFRRAGRVDSLLMALAFLKEASRTRDVPLETISYLRSFLRRLEEHPNLLFVPPPPLS